MTIYTIYRVERDGTRTVVSCTNDAYEVGLIISEDRHDIDFEPQYEIVPDYGESEDKTT